MRARGVIVAGLVGALAMVPVGLALSAAGFEVNRYGELLAEQLTGSRRPVVVLALHLLIGVVSAVPLAVAAVLRPRRVIMLVGGAVYGAAYWLGVNALALPLVYHRPFPWIESVASVWPSLLLHLVYGVTVALVVARSQAAGPDAAGPRHHGTHCGLCPLLRAARRRGATRGPAPRPRHGGPGRRAHRGRTAPGAVS